MADRRAKNPADRGAGWFVDTTCIDCDVARLVAPDLIAEDASGRSFFVRPPRGVEEERHAWRALLACPTGSIGAPAGVRAPADVFPWKIGTDVFLNGFNDESSFGANSYLVQRPAGNLLVDSPRWNERLASAFERMGGIRHILLTHRDDVCDYERYQRKFGARVWIQSADADAAPTATDVFEEASEVAPHVRAIHIPGHTRGSSCFLVDDRTLFTGDSLYWSRTLGDLNSFRDATWYSWAEQTRSLARLATSARFEWVFPGHGGWGHATADEMHRRLASLVERMKDGTVAVAW